MTYQALARKWRPRRFSELVGQAHVVRALSYALDQQKLHHALLFSGTRGVGKTTLGRILAKCLNCDAGVSSTPCADELCRSCAEIEEGRFIDLIEVDAASRTGVDDTRDLIANVQYAPGRGRYKVYLIDEVHMLSRPAFNALLKTLEEPPPHVQFLLATTAPQKIPVTILSRCLQFPLKRLPVAEIDGQLQRILTAEAIDAEPAALTAIARAADGSMRDALSLLDQAVAFGGGRLTAEEVRELLGKVGTAAMGTVLQAIAAADAAALLAALAALDERAPDYGALLEALAAACHRIAVLQLLPDAATADDESLVALARSLAPEEIQIFYDIALSGRRDLAWAPDPASGLEMTCLRMLAFRPADAGPAPHCRANDQPVTPPRQPRPDPRVSGPAAQPPTAPEHGGEPHPAPAPDPGAAWDDLVARLALRGVAAELARNCVCLKLDSEQVTLKLPERLKHLQTPRAHKQIQQALGQGVRLELGIGAGDGESPAKRDLTRATQRRTTALRQLQEDPNVQALQALGAELKSDSVEPTND